MNRLAIENCCSYIVWGTGQYFRSINKLLNLNIFCFVDNDENKQNEMINGKPIISPAQLAVYKKQFKIIICSDFYEQIKNQLIEMDYIEGEDFFPAWLLLDINEILFLDNQIKRKLGFNNYESNWVSGERALLKSLKGWKANLVLFDIGANKGEYLKEAFNEINNLEAFAFEPVSWNFEKLQLNCPNANNFNLALGSENGKTVIYDRLDFKGSEHASLNKEIFEKIHKVDTFSEEIQITTIDEIVQEYNIKKIHFLKIDTEGHEYNVLMGAKECLRNSRIDLIQFEFNMMNKLERKFLYDFFDLLYDFDFYRLLSNGIYKLTPDENNEVFEFQNILAVHKNSDYLKRNIIFINEIVGKFIEE